MKTQKIFYLFLLFLGCSIIYACKKEKSENNLPVSTKMESKDSLLYLSKIDQFYNHLEKQNLKAASIKLKELERVSMETQNEFYLGKTYALKGYLNVLENKHDSSFYHNNLAKKHFLTIGDSVHVAKSLGNMAISQANSGDYLGSEMTATEALKYLKTKPDFISSIYNCLALSSDALDNHREAIYWNEKAQNATNDLYSQQLYKNNIAVSYQFLNEFPKSLQILEQMLGDTVVTQNPALHAKIIDNIAYSQFKIHPKENVENQFQEALQMRIENQDVWGQNVSHARLSEYFKDKNPEKSLFHAKKMYTIATELNSPDDRLEALQKLIDLEIPENAKKYAIRYASLSDSLVKARNQAKDKFAKIQYDSDKNREENELLRTETAEQELEIERRKVFGIMSVSAIVLLFIGFMTYQRIQSFKNQEKLNDEIHATEMKISGKVHDDIANNLYGVLSYLERNKEAISKEIQVELSENLDEIYQLSRNISRENSAIETGENYPEELLNLFSNFKNEKTNIVLMGFAEEPWKKVKSETKIQFYKVVQELLINMKKHSQASVVVLKFEFNENKLDFFYSDNGIGITENQMIKKNGIQITENRIEKIKGTISFVAEPNKGLKINIMIPL